MIFDSRFNVDCGASAGLYSLNEKIGDEGPVL
jgi:hypothetical protein